MATPQPAPVTVTSIAGRILSVWQSGQGEALEQVLAHGLPPVAGSGDCLEMERTELLESVIESLRTAPQVNDPGGRDRIRAAVRLLEHLASGRPV